MLNVRIGIVLIIAFFLASCGTTGNMVVQDIEQGNSIVVFLKDNNQKKGVAISAENQSLKYIDTESNQPQTINLNDILYVRPSDVVFDLEAKPISETEIRSRKGLLRTTGYSVGGVVLGSAAGFLAGIAVKNFLFPMAVGAIGGGIYFGIMGAESDRNVAIEDIRSERFEASKSRLEDELTKTREEIEQKKKEKAKLQKVLNEIEKAKSGKKDD